MKISFISTVLNEEDTIDSFLDSLLEQTKLPHEIVIVDGGSTDKTVEKIQKKIKIKRIKNFKLIKINGANRSVGRNRAIEKSKGEVIAVSDAGCILDKRWLEEITKPFKENKKISVVGGFYLPFGDNIFQKILGELTSVPIEKVDPKKFLPSSRSIAFKKKAWKRVNGYPEDLNYCEDLVFVLKLKKANEPFGFNKKAFVWWKQEKNFIRATKQFFNYSMGDGMAGILSPHFFKNLLKLVSLFLFLLIYLRFRLNLLTVAFLLSILVFYSIKSLRIAFKIKSPICFFISMFVLPLFSLVVVLGFTFGIINNFLNIKFKC